MPTSRLDLGRALLVPVFFLLLIVNAVGLTDEVNRSPIAVAGTVMALAFYAVLVVMYLRRGAASQTDRRPHVWLVAGGATFSPFFIPLTGPGGASTPVATTGSVLVAGGIGLSVWALLSLGTNISVVPQSRQLAASGPYTFFRHPLYVFEFLSAIGLVLVNGGGWAWFVLLLLAVFQVLRARWEEDLLHAQIPEYAAYRHRTPGFGRG